jgi:uncharacterized membrane protein
MMSRKSFLFGIFIFFVSLIPQAASAVENVDDFTAHIEMRPDGSVFVQEEIRYNFGTEARHGIYRRIPLMYKLPGGKEGFVELANISVTDGEGNTRDVKTDGGGNVFELKIGDPDKLVTGEQFYVIRYVAYGAINHLPVADELYWNVTGNEWTAPMTRVRTEVILPKEFEQNEVTYSCYRGQHGATEGCESNVAPGGATGTVASVHFLTLGLAVNEGMTIAVSVPKGYIAIDTEHGPQSVSTFERLLRLWGPWLLPVIVFWLMFRLWWTRGRDPKGRGTIVTEYEVPNNLTPIEVAALLNDTIDNGIISAEIVALAERGYLTIRQIEKKGLIFSSEDYELSKAKTFESLAPVDKLLLEGIFADGADHVYLSKLKEGGEMPGIIGKVKSAAFDSLTQAGYYEGQPEKVRGSYLLTGVGIAVVTTFLSSFALPGYVTAAIVFIFGWFMPKHSLKGALVKEQILGFKKYLSVAEKDRIEFAGAPEKKPETFERLLPYAMALGVTALWAKQFEGIYTEKNNPGWYSGANMAVFSSTAFADDMSSFSTHAATFMSPSGGASGGGGFSGGGGGGGGGGSW